MYRRPLECLLSSVRHDHFHLGLFRCERLERVKRRCPATSIGEALPANASLGSCARVRFGALVFDKGIVSGCCQWRRNVRKNTATGALGVCDTSFHWKSTPSEAPILAGNAQQLSTHRLERQEDDWPRVGTMVWMHKFERTVNYRDNVHGWTGMVVRPTEAVV